MYRNNILLNVVGLPLLLPLAFAYLAAVVVFVLRTALLKNPSRTAGGNGTTRANLPLP